MYSDDLQSQSWSILGQFGIETRQKY